MTLGKLNIGNRFRYRVGGPVYTIIGVEHGANHRGRYIQYRDEQGRVSAHVSDTPVIEEPSEAQPWIWE